MSKFKNKNKLHYVKGFCELETGIVEFVGGMYGVSTSQTWYHTIYAIRDKYTHIDFWIDPKFDVCKTIHPTENFLRRGICSTFKCKYKKFKNGEIRPKLKLTDIDKKKYNQERSKVDLGIIIEEVNSWKDVLNVYTKDMDEYFKELEKDFKNFCDIERVIGNIKLKNFDDNYIHNLQRDFYNEIESATIFFNKESLSNFFENMLSLEYSFKNDLDYLIERNINVTNDINISSYLMQESILQEGRIDEYGKHVEYVFQ